MFQFWIPDSRVSDNLIYVDSSGFSKAFFKNSHNFQELTITRRATATTRPRAVSRPTEARAGAGERPGGTRAWVSIDKSTQPSWHVTEVCKKCYYRTTQQRTYPRAYHTKSVWSHSLMRIWSDISTKGKKISNESLIGMKSRHNIVMLYARDFS